MIGLYIIIRVYVFSIRVYIIRVSLSIMKLMIMADRV